MMKHIEIHVVNDPREARLLEVAGLPTLSASGDSCNACGGDVGATEDSFVPVAVILDDTRDWRLCVVCAGASLYPRR